jgi:hypothetical protein
MTKKMAYERPTLAKAGSFAKQTAGSLFTSCRESFLTQKPKFLCQ